MCNSLHLYNIYSFRLWCLVAVVFSSLLALRGPDDFIHTLSMYSTPDVSPPADVQPSATWRCLECMCHSIDELLLWHVSCWSQTIHKSQSCFPSSQKGLITPLISRYISNGKLSIYFPAKPTIWPCHVCFKVQYGEISHLVFN